MSGVPEGSVGLRRESHEEHLVGRIAGLVLVPHPDFIDEEIGARAESEAGKE